MAKRDIVVIGASAGGIGPILQTVSAFPPDLGAAVFVIIHEPPSHDSKLPEILSRAGPIPAEESVSGTPIEPGRIYVAAPDYHVILNGDGLIQLWHGPREDRHRPAINATFRSVAVAYRERVIGVVLSGVLEDGAAGLWWIKRYGGIAIVQDPRDADFPDMPRAALDQVEVDHVARAAEIGRLIAQLTSDATSEHVSLGDEQK